MSKLAEVIDFPINNEADKTPSMELDSSGFSQSQPTDDHMAFVEGCRIIEALLFASAQPLTEVELSSRLPKGVDLQAVLTRLVADYRGRGITLSKSVNGWLFHTAEDLGFLLARETQETRKLSRAALETLSVIAYHQPVTRAEIEDIRGVTIHRGTLDVLMETGWVRLRGRRKTPGRPVTYGTTAQFLTHFGLEAISDLPGLDDLKGAGFLDGRLPQGFNVPMPSDSPELTADEDPLEDDQMVLIHEELHGAEAPLDEGDEAGSQNEEDNLTVMGDETSNFTATDHNEGLSSEKNH
jgi:segregation and condensation protein B